MIIQICVGSSCHIKGAPIIVELFQQKIADYRLNDDVTLVGSFCAGKCNRVGVTVTIDDEVFTSITPENFDAFWNNTVLPRLNTDKEA